MANKDSTNYFGDKALTTAQAQNITKQVDEYNKLIDSTKQFLSEEDKRKPLLNKPYRFLDNLSPFLQTAILFPERIGKDSDTFEWKRVEIPNNVINIKELTISSDGSEVSIACYDPDYVFLQELDLKINSYNSRGIQIKIEIEYGWAAPDSLKREYPNITFTDIIHMSNIQSKFTDMRSGASVTFTGAADQLIVPIGQRLNPAATMGLGSIASYITIYDFICLDFQDRIELIWDNLKDPKQKKDFIFGYLSYLGATDFPREIFMSVLDKASKTDKAKNALFILNSGKFNVKKYIEGIEKKSKLPRSPYSVLLYLRNQKNKAFAKSLSENFLTPIDIVMQNYRVHPYRVYKFLVDVFQNDVLKDPEYAKIDETRFVDIDFIDFNTIGGNFKVTSKNIKTYTGKTNYLEAINVLHNSLTAGNPAPYGGDLGRDYRELVREVYKLSKSKNKTALKEFNQYFLPIKDYGLSTEQSFEKLIPIVASKCRRKDNIVSKGSAPQTDDSNYVCQLFRATPASAYQNLKVLKLISENKKSKKVVKSEEIIIEKINSLEAEMFKILSDKTKSKANEVAAIFCLFGPNQLTAILNNSNASKNQILTTYSYRMRSLQNENYFNSGSEDFTRNNFPDVLSFEVERKDESGKGSGASTTPYVIAGADHKFFLDATNAGVLTKGGGTIIEKAKELRKLKENIEKQQYEVFDQKKKGNESSESVKELARLRRDYDNLLYGASDSKGKRKGGLVEFLRNDVFKKILDDAKSKNIFENLPSSSNIRSIKESLSAENSIDKRLEEKKLEASKNKKVKFDLDETKYELSKSDFNAIDSFLEAYEKAFMKNSLFPAFNLSFNDPVLFGAGSSPTGEGIAANKQMENYRRMKALDSNSIEVTLTVLGNPELKRHYSNGAGAAVFLNVYSSDGTLSEFTGEYGIGTIEYKHSAGVYTNILKLTKNPTVNDNVINYIQNNDILSIC